MRITKAVTAGSHGSVYQGLLYEPDSKLPRMAVVMKQLDPEGDLSEETLRRVSGAKLHVLH